MTIEKKQWQEWASDFAAKEADDFSKHVALTLEQQVILKAKIETGVLLGLDLVETMRREGYDTSEAIGLKAGLMKAQKEGK